MTPSNILNLFSRQVWAIEPGWVRGVAAALPEIIGTFKARMAADGESKAASQGLRTQSDTKIGVLKLSGPLVKGMDPDEAEWYGACSYDTIHRAADKVRADGINHLVLHLDSPGGMVCGCAEAAERITQLRSEGVTVTAYTDTLACSAAYWLAAACDEIIAAPSAMVGSIGCICLCLDNSGLYEKLGLKTEYFVNQGSEAKLYGRSGQPWTDEAKASFQASVDAVGDSFREFIKARRPGIADSDINGEAWDAKAAPAGYVDHMAFTTPAGSLTMSTLDDLLEVLTAPNPD